MPSELHPSPSLGQMVAERVASRAGSSLRNYAGMETSFPGRNCLAWMRIFLNAAVAIFAGAPVVLAAAVGAFLHV
jgi:hypothetical protein